MAGEAVLPAKPSGSRLLAAAFLVGGVFVFSLQDVILKWVSGSYPLTQAVAIRSSTAIVILLIAIALREGLHKIFSRRWRALALRGSILMIAYGTYYLAFPAMKLAEVVTLFFIAPILITALGQPLLGERVSFSRWLAVLAGFTGVVVTYWPKLIGSNDGVIGGSALDWALLLPIVAALTYALSALMARGLGPTESASVMALYQNAMFLLWVLVLAAVFSMGWFPQTDMHPSLTFLLRSWSFDDWAEIAALVACGPISAVGTVLLTQAYRMTEANFVATFEYTGLIWATSWGFFVWREVPDLYMVAGAALIVGAGLYMLFSGRRAK
jgi:drug/metabolite transporter (DMT)-like permease